MFTCKLKDAHTLCIGQRKTGKKKGETEKGKEVKKKRKKERKRGYRGGNTVVLICKSKTL